MWSLRRLLFARQTGSSLLILEVCGFRFRQFSGSRDQIVNTSAPNPMYRQNAAMLTLYSMVNETGNRNRVIEVCKFRIWFQQVHCGTIMSVTRYGFRQILHADKKLDRFYVWCFGNRKPEVDIRFQRCADSDFCYFWVWSPHFSGSAQNSAQS